MYQRWFFAVLLLCSVVVAKPHPAPGGWGFSAECLYMLNGITTPVYQISAPDPVTMELREHVNPPQWHAGLRLEAIYQFCDPTQALRLRWTYFPTFSDRDRSGPGTLPLLAISGTSFIVDKYDYQAASLLYDHLLLQCAPFSLSVQAGIEYTRIQLQERVVAFDENGAPLLDYQGDSQQAGVGPEAGVEMEYLLSKCLSIDTRVTGALVIANKKLRTDISFISTAIPISAQPYWFCLPIANMRLGLTYHVVLPQCMRFCSVLNVELGYEVIAFFNAFERLQATIDFTTHNRDFLLYGPYLQLGCSF